MCCGSEDLPRVEFFIKYLYAPGQVAAEIFRTANFQSKYELKVGKSHESYLELRGLFKVTGLEKGGEFLGAHETRAS